MQQASAFKMPEPAPHSYRCGSLVLVDTLKIPERVRCHSEDGELKRVIVHPPKYLGWTSATAINNVEAANKPPSAAQVMREHETLVETLLKEGVDVVMASPNEELPEGVYQRDALGVIGETAFTAQFKYGIRQKETGTISGASAPWKAGDIVEFGDVLLCGDFILVGMGDRTNAQGLDTLRKVITDKEVIGVPLTKGTLHLDYALSIGGRGRMRTVIACLGAFEVGKEGSIIRHLIERLQPPNFIFVDKSQQLHGLTNVFYINPETVVSTTRAGWVNENLRKRGFRVIEIPFDGILTGEGAPRCCTAPLWRAD